MSKAVIHGNLNNPSIAVCNPCFSSYNSRIARIESEFYKLIDLKETVEKVGLENEVVDYIYRYWLLKRKSAGNKPLMPAKSQVYRKAALVGQMWLNYHKVLLSYVLNRQPVSTIRSIEIFSLCSSRTRNSSR